MNAIIAGEAVRSGWRRAVRVGLAAPVVDTLFLLLVAGGLPRLLPVERIERPAAAFGAVLLAWFAIAAARADPLRPDMRWHSFWGVFVLSATNPYQLAWWASGGVALLARIGWQGALAFLVAIYAWVLAFAAAMARGAQKWAWFQPLVQVVSADALLAYALRLAVRAA